MVDQNLIRYEFDLFKLNQNRVIHHLNMIQTKTDLNILFASSDKKLYVFNMIKQLLDN